MCYVRFVLYFAEYSRFAVQKMLKNWAFFKVLLHRLLLRCYVVTLSSYFISSSCHLSSCYIIIMLSSSLSIFFASTHNSIACDGCHLCCLHPPTFAQAITLALHAIVSIWSSSYHDAQNIKRTLLDLPAILSHLEASLSSSWIKEYVTLWACHLDQQLIGPSSVALPCHRACHSMTHVRYEAASHRCLHSEVETFLYRVM